MQRKVINNQVQLHYYHYYYPSLIKPDTKLPGIRRCRSSLPCHASHCIQTRIHRHIWSLLHVWRPWILSHAPIVRLRRPWLPETLLLPGKHARLRPLHHLLVALHHRSRVVGVVAVLLTHTCLHVAVLLREHVL